MVLWCHTFIADDPDVSLQAVKPMVAFCVRDLYRSYTCEHIGIDREIAGRIVTALECDPLTSHDSPAVFKAAKTVPDELAEKIALVGNPSNIIEKISEFGKMVNQITILPNIPADLKEHEFESGLKLIDRFAKEVLPHFR